MKKMLKPASVLAVLVMLLAFLGCGNDSEDMTPIYYTVTFDANGGEGSMTIQKFIVDEAKPLQANAFTPIDYNFIGWNTKKDGSGANYADEAIVKNLATTNGANITLYAHWTPNKDNTDDMTPNESGDNTDDMTSNEDSDNTDNMTPNEGGDNTDDMTSNEDSDNTDNMTSNEDNGNTDDIPPNEDSDNTDNMTPNEGGDNTDDMTSNEDNGNTDNMPPNGNNNNTDDIPPNEDNDNTDNEPQYVWLPVSISSHSENSNTEGTEEWVYYNNSLDYKYIYESQSKIQTEQSTVISTTAYTIVSTERCSSVNSVTTTYTYDSDGNKISNLLYQSEAVTTYFEELLPRIFTITKSSYQKLTSNDGNVFENNTDYDLEYLGEENDCKVYKHILNNGISYTIYKIKDGMIQEQDNYYDDKLNSITKSSVSGDEFLAELKFQDYASYDANGNLTSTTKCILNSKNENEASIDLVTSTTTYENVNSYKYKRFMYPF